MLLGSMVGFVAAGAAGAATNIFGAGQTPRGFSLNGGDGDGEGGGAGPGPGGRGVGLQVGSFCLLDAEMGAAVKEPHFWLLLLPGV